MTELRRFLSAVISSAGLVGSLEPPRKARIILFGYAVTAGVNYRSDPDRFGDWGNGGRAQNDHSGGFGHWRY